MPARRDDETSSNMTTFSSDSSQTSSRRRDRQNKVTFRSKSSRSKFTRATTRRSDTDSDETDSSRSSRSSRSRSRSPSSGSSTGSSTRSTSRDSALSGGSTHTISSRYAQTRSSSGSDSPRSSRTSGTSSGPSVYTSDIVSDADSFDGFFDSEDSNSSRPSTSSNSSLSGGSSSGKKKKKSKSKSKKSKKTSSSRSSSRSSRSGKKSSRSGKRIRRSRFAVAGPRTVLSDADRAIQAQIDEQYGYSRKMNKHIDLLIKRRKAWMKHASKNQALKGRDMAEDATFTGTSQALGKLVLAEDDYSDEGCEDPERNAWIDRQIGAGRYDDVTGGVQADERGMGIDAVGNRTIVDHGRARAYAEGNRELDRLDRRWELDREQNRAHRLHEIKAARKRGDEALALKLEEEAAEREADEEEDRRTQKAIKLKYIRIYRLLREQGEHVRRNMQRELAEEGLTYVSWYGRERMKIRWREARERMGMENEVNDTDPKRLQQYLSQLMTLCQNGDIAKVRSFQKASGMMGRNGKLLKYNMPSRSCVLALMKEIRVMQSILASRLHRGVRVQDGDACDTLKNLGAGADLGVASAAADHGIQLPIGDSLGRNQQLEGVLIVDHNLRRGGGRDRRGHDHDPFGDRNGQASGHAGAGRVMEVRVGAGQYGTNIDGTYGVHTRGTDGRGARVGGRAHGYQDTAEAGVDGVLTNADDDRKCCGGTCNAHFGWWMVLLGFIVLMCGVIYLIVNGTGRSSNATGDRV